MFKVSINDRPELNKNEFGFDGSVKNLFGHLAYRDGGYFGKPFVVCTIAETDYLPHELPAGDCTVRDVQAAGHLEENMKLIDDARLQGFIVISETYPQQ